tara:strand:- start:105 stop:356 length:252 start_codon:yes stop_codon:yes gene_type:complete
MTNHIDIYKNQYSTEELKEMLNGTISQTAILLNQKLNAEFCAKYILNDKYSLNDNDRYLDFNDVLNYQPHITEEELIEEYNKI